MFPTTDIELLTDRGSKFQTFEKPPVFMTADPRMLGGKKRGFSYRAQVLGNCIEALGGEVFYSDNESWWPRNGGMLIDKYDTSILIKGIQAEEIPNYGRYTSNVIKADFDFGGSGNVIYFEPKNVLLYGIDSKIGIGRHFNEFVDLVKTRISPDITVLPIEPRKGAQPNEVYHLDVYLAITNEGHIAYSPDLISEASLKTLEGIALKESKFVEITEKVGVNFCQVGKYILGSFNHRDRANLEKLGYLPITEQDLKEGNPILVTSRPGDVDPGRDFSFIDKALFQAGPNCYTQTMFKGEGAKIIDQSKFRT